VKTGGGHSGVWTPAPGGDTLGRIVGGFIFGLVFLGVGLAVMWFMGAQTRLACERLEPRSGTCMLTQANVFGRVSRRVSLRLNEIQRAVVEVSEGDDGDTYRVALRTETGEVPFTDYYSSGRGDKEADAAAINAFLEGREAGSFEALQDDRLFSSLFGGIFACVGGLVAIGGLLAPFARLFSR
jgi:hypothetical protein